VSAAEAIREKCAYLFTVPALRPRQFLLIRKGSEENSSTISVGGLKETVTELTNVSFAILLIKTVQIEQKNLPFHLLNA
jgi:hypothetical protein